MRKVIHAVWITMVLFMTVGCLNVYGAAEEAIPKGVSIGVVDVSGLNSDQALTKVNEFVNSLQDATITAKIQENTESIKGSTLNITWTNQEIVNEAAALDKCGNIVNRYKVKKDLENSPKKLPLNLSVDQDALDSFVKYDCGQYDVKAVNMGMTRNEDTGKLTIVDGQDGHKLNVEASKNIIMDYVTDKWTGGDATIDLQVDVDESKGSREDLEKIQDRLGASSTDYSSSSSNRATNIKVGTTKINGALLYPGESLSVLDTVTPFDEEHGYKTAPSYESGAVVDSYGGGICQVSTTLYLAVIRAELQVDERHPHSMQVSYVKPSMDAAIAEGSKDFKFTNNTESPIYIEGFADGSEIGFRIYGKETRDPDRKVTFESETNSKTDSEMSLAADSDKPIGYLEKTASGHDGLQATLWKIVTENGKEEKTEFNHSTYNMTPTTYSVGVKSENATGTSKMYAAIDSKSLDKVYSTMNEYE